MRKTEKSRRVVKSRPCSLLRRGLHEVSSEGKVSAQGVMGRAK
jgi:hypothetical protein